MGYTKDEAVAHLRDYFGMKSWQAYYLLSLAKDVVLAKDDSESEFLVAPDAPDPRAGTWRVSLQADGTYDITKITPEQETRP